MPALCRARPLQTPQRGPEPAQRWLHETQKHNRLLMAGRTLAVSGCGFAASFFPPSNLEHEGRFGFTAQMTVAGTLRFIKPNETAHCSQRTDTGHRSNPHAAMTGLQMTPTDWFSPLTTWDFLLPRVFTPDPSY